MELYALKLQLKFQHRQKWFYLFEIFNDLNTLTIMYIMTTPMNGLELFSLFGFANVLLFEFLAWMSNQCRFKCDTKRIFL